MTRWDEDIADYLRLRRQLGFSLPRDEHMLGEFTAYLSAAGIDHITAPEAVAWAGLLPAGAATRAATRASRRLSAVRSFASYMHSVDPIHQIPPEGSFARRVQRPTPHIYTDAEVTALIEAAGHLIRGVRAQTYPVLFGLLAATGLRVGEALSLNRVDTDLKAGVLAINRGTKSRITRLVPLHPSTTTALARYADWRHDLLQGHGGGDAPFFIDQGGTRLVYSNARHAFGQASTIAGIGAKTRHPRMHNLRHTFTVNTLLGWYRNGEDVAAKMPGLSTYLGHTDPANTYWYLSAVPELLAHAADRLTIADQEVRP